MCYNLPLKIFSLIALVSFAGAVPCPPKELVYPCQCDNIPGGPEIVCLGQSGVDLIPFLQKLGARVKERNFLQLRVQGTKLKELPERFAGNLTFKSFQFYGNRNLSYIHPNAFAGPTSNITERLRIDMSNLTNNAPNERHMFDFARRLPNLREYILYQNSLDSIPPYALNGTQLREFRVSFNKRGIKSIGDYAFYELDQLNDLT